MSTISDIFGTMVFIESVMRERLPKETYNALKKTIEDNGFDFDKRMKEIYG